MSTIAPNDANIVYSPYTWLVTAGTAKTINAGAYLRVAFSGAPTTLSASFDVAGMYSTPSRVAIRIDGGNWSESAVAASIPITIPTTNTWSTHVVEIVFVSHSESADRWNTQQSAVIFTGLTGDTTLTTRTMRKRGLRGLCVGDSITEGVRTLTMSGTETLRNNSRLSWSYPLGELLGAEIGQVGFGGTGISKAGSGNVPRFPLSAPYLWSGQARSYAEVPDFIVAHIGANDSASLDADVVTDTTALVNHWIASTPETTAIFILPNWLGRKAAQIQSGIAASTSPFRVTYVDTTGWWNSADASDGLHPYGYINVSDLAPRLAGTIRTKLAGSPSFYRRSSTGTAVPVY